MFDVGFFELLLISTVALLVLGPERLPKAARTVGLWMRRARGAWYSMRAQIEREMADDELKRSLASTRAELEDARRALTESGKDVAEAGKSLSDDLREAEQSLRDSASTTEPSPASAEQLPAPGAADRPAA